MLDLKALEFNLSLQIPSSIIKIDIKPLGVHSSIDLIVKREDEIHPVISGNKWRKLKYNINYYFTHRFERIISYGGAYSNHLYALGKVCEALDIPLTCIIRGDGYDEHNETLKALKNWRHELIFVSRSAYREKEKSTEIKSIINRYENFLLVPEGGSSALAGRGIYEMCEELDWESINHLVLAAGTGATAGYIANYILQHDINCQLHIISVLKGDWMQDAVSNFCPDCKKDTRIQVHNEYHFGGYARVNETLEQFQKQVQQKINLPLDKVYNSKAFYGLIDLMRTGIIPNDTQVVFINTGGRR